MGRYGAIHHSFSRLAEFRHLAGTGTGPAKTGVYALALSGIFPGDDNTGRNVRTWRQSSREPIRPGKERSMRCQALPASTSLVSALAWLALVPAQAQTAAALAGQVSSAEEGAMEG